jgi:hypothetical protein
MNFSKLFIENTLRLLRGVNTYFGEYKVKPHRDICRIANESRAAIYRYMALLVCSYGYLVYKM